MAEDIFKEFTPAEIAKAYEELCEELCDMPDLLNGDVETCEVCCDDEANLIDEQTVASDAEDTSFASTAAPADEDGEVRAELIISCMASVESQMESMSQNSSKIVELINLKYAIEELYYHYLVLGQYYEGKHTFVKYMQDETAAGGIRATNAQAHFVTAIKYTPPSALEVLNPSNQTSTRLRVFTDQGILSYNSGKARLELRLKAGLTEDSLLPRLPRDYQEDNQLILFKNKERQNNGLLYTTYLDAAGNLDNVFTLQERGLSADTPDPTLVGTGAEGFMDKYIGDLTVFNDFYSKFKPKFESKMEERRGILPGLAYVAGESLRQHAEHETAQRIRFYGYENALAWSVTEGTYYNDKLSQIKRDLVWVYDEIKNTEDDLMSSGEAVTGITCLGEAALDPDPNKENSPVFDGDDAGKAAGLDFSDTIKFPNFTDMAYWRRFSLMATLVGILPLPGPGLFRYWPIGLILPPGIRLPLPIIWLPIKAIATPFGVFVFFIGLSGIFPSPFLFFISPTGQKSFLISITPTVSFGTDASKPPTKGISSGGIAFPVPIFKKPQISSKDSVKNMVETFTGKITERLSIKQDDLVAYNSAPDKSVVVGGIISRCMKGLDFTWTYPSGSAKTNPKKSDAQTLKDTKVGDAKSALAAISIIGKLKKIQAPKLPFGPLQIPVKIAANQILSILLSKIKIFPDMVPATAQDLKTIIMDSVEGSSLDIISYFAPLLSVADKLGDVSPKTIPETFKLLKIGFSTTTVSEIDPVVLKIAKKAVAAISLIPYPAVAFLPQLFKQLHPILSNDDLPPWERLSLKNFLFVAFLDDFCKTGKMGSIMPV